MARKKVQKACFFAASRNHVHWILRSAAAIRTGQGAKFSDRKLDLQIVSDLIAIAEVGFSQIPGAEIVVADDVVIDVQEGVRLCSHPRHRISAHQKAKTRIRDC
jgi:hypothetical protein